MSPTVVEQYIESNGIEMVFVGPRERALGGDFSWTKDFTVAYENPDVTLFQTDLGR
jgi:hypothetical protein